MHARLTALLHQRMWHMQPHGKKACAEPRTTMHAPCEKYLTSSSDVSISSLYPHFPAEPRHSRPPFAATHGPAVGSTPPTSSQPPSFHCAPAIELDSEVLWSSDVSLDPAPPPTATLFQSLAPHSSFSGAEHESSPSMPFQPLFINPLQNELSAVSYTHLTLPTILLV